MTVLTTPPRVGASTRMYSGKKFYPLDPRPEDFDIEDIAVGLAREPRWNGQTDETYCVGEHSILVAKLLPVEYQLVGLLHDASEAYMKDLPGPIKHMTALAAYREMENSVQQVIYRAFGVEPLSKEEYRRIIKPIDKQVQVTEARDLFTPSRVLDDPGFEDIEPLDQTISPIGEIAQRKFFLRAYRELTGQEPRIIMSAS